MYTSTWPAVHCSAANLLAAGGGPMGKRPKRGVPTDTITIRMPTEKIARLKRESVGALMSTSAYVEALLDGDEPEACPALAALAYVVAIHEIVAENEAITSDQLH